MKTHILTLTMVWAFAISLASAQSSTTVHAAESAHGPAVNSMLIDSTTYQPEGFDPGQNPYRIPIPLPWVERDPRPEPLPWPMPDRVPSPWRGLRPVPYPLPLPPVYELPRLRPRRNFPAWHGNVLLDHAELQ